MSTIIPTCAALVSPRYLIHKSISSVLPITKCGVSVWYHYEHGVLNNVPTTFSFWYFSEHQNISKEVEYIYKAAASAGIIGWAYGGIPAFIHAKNRYIEQSQGAIYHNRFDAVVSTDGLMGIHQFNYSLYTSFLLDIELGEFWNVRVKKLNLQQWKH